MRRNMALAGCFHEERYTLSRCAGLRWGIPFLLDQGYAMTRSPGQIVVAGFGDFDVAPGVPALGV